MIFKDAVFLDLRIYFEGGVKNKNLFKISPTFFS